MFTVLRVSHLWESVLFSEVTSQACPLCLFLFKCSISFHPKRKRIEERIKQHRKLRTFQSLLRGSGHWNTPPESPLPADTGGGARELHFQQAPDRLFSQLNIQAWGTWYLGM